MTIDLFKMQISGVLFDMDGVLVDTEYVSKAIWRAMGILVGRLSGTGTEEIESELTLDFLLQFNGRTKAELSRLCSQLLPSLPFDVFSEIKSQVMRELDVAFGVRLKPGAAKFMEHLSNNGIKVGVVSSSDKARVTAVLERGGIKRYVRGIIGGDDVTRGKPDPEPYLAGARMLGISPRNIMVFEDAPIGVTSAFKAGCFPCFVRDIISAETNEVKNMTGDRIFESLEEAMSYVKLAQLMIFFPSCC